MHQWPDTNLLKGLLRQARPDQEQRRRQANLAEMVQRAKHRPQTRQIGTQRSRHAEQHDEPGNLYPGTGTSIASARSTSRDKRRGDQGHRHNP